MGFLRVLLQRHLAILWTSQVLSAMGDYFYAIAVLWIAVRVAGSAAGFVAAAETGASFVFGLLGGVYADRWNRRHMMIVADLLRGAAVLTLPFLARTGTLPLWYLVGVAIVLGGLGSFFDPALQASLPALAGDARTLQATNGLMDMTRRLARAIGPSLAGLLVAFLPLEQFFTLDAVSFGVSALAIFILGARYAWKPERAATPAQTGVRGIVREIGSALRLVRSRAELTWALIGQCLINLLWALAFTLGAPILAAHNLGHSVGAYGLIVGAYGVGNVASNVVVSNLRVRRPLVWLFGGKVVLGMGFLLLAAAPSLPVALLGSALAATGGPMGDIPLLTMIQLDLPPTQLGKIFSLLETLVHGGMLVGTLLAVPLFARFDARLVIGGCALLMTAMGVAGLARFGASKPPGTLDAEAPTSVEALH
ncbi:MAG TPA: MFS transporter [Ktedonobacterales bacterium]